MANLIYKNRSAVIKNLTKLRDDISRRSGLENYKVLKYETIELIATTMPKDLNELGGIKGIGPKKLAQFGEMILGVVNGEVEEAVPEKEEMTKKNDQIYSVDEFLDKINDTLNKDIEDCFIQGEISGLSERPSGFFFSLADKEEEAVLYCYLPASNARMIGFGLEDGMEIKVSGSVNIWKPKGRMSFVVKSLELLGEGALKRAYEALKTRLADEGLFVRKRPLPEIIKKIGIITSGKGAVIHDFRKNITSRGLGLDLFDVRVEGASAVADIIRAIRYFNSHPDNYDVLVIMRGGGSLEDMQAFNHEQVGRAIFASGIPTIAAVGHDKDVPIVNLIADREVSTPTAAAVLIGEYWQVLEERLEGAKRDIIEEMDSMTEKRMFKLSLNTSTILRSLDRIKSGYMSKMRAFKLQVMRTNEIIRTRKNDLWHLSQSILRGLDGDRDKFLKTIENYSVLIKSQDPDRILRLGYSYVTNNAGTTIRDNNDIQVGDELKTKLYSGSFISKVKNKLK